MVLVSRRMLSLRPTPRLTPLALRAVSVATGVVEHLAFVTTFTLEGEAAEHGGSTLAKMSQHLPPSRIDPMLRLIGREELGEHTL